jgi:hypothetical protein
LVMSAAIAGDGLYGDDHPCCLGRPVGVSFFHTGAASQSWLIQKVLTASTRRTARFLFDGVCVLCSRGCGFVSKRDRRGYFRFVGSEH